jgi:hypothetical protein
MDEEHQFMREKVAEEYGFSLYRLYGEAQAAHYLGVDLSTLKRRRNKGQVPHVRLGERQVRYLGLHVADMILGYVKENGAA